MTFQQDGFACFHYSHRCIFWHDPGDPGGVERWTANHHQQRPTWGTQLQLQLMFQTVFLQFLLRNGNWFRTNLLIHDFLLFLILDLASHPLWQFHNMKLAHRNRHLRYHTLAWINHCLWFHGQSVNQPCLQFFQLRVNHAVCSLLQELWLHANPIHLFTLTTRLLQVKRGWRRSTTTLGRRRSPA